MTKAGTFHQHLLPSYNLPPTTPDTARVTLTRSPPPHNTLASPRLGGYELLRFGFGGYELWRLWPWSF